MFRRPVCKMQASSSSQIPHLTPKMVSHSFSDMFKSLNNRLFIAVWYGICQDSAHWNRYVGKIEYRILSFWLWAKKCNNAVDLSILGSTFQFALISTSNFELSSHSFVHRDSRRDDMLQYILWTNFWHFTCEILSIGSFPYHSSYHPAKSAKTFHSVTESGTLK